MTKLNLKKETSERLEVTHPGGSQQTSVQTHPQSRDGRLAVPQHCTPASQGGTPLRWTDIHCHCVLYSF